MSHVEVSILLSYTHNPGTPQDGSSFKVSSSFSDVNTNECRVIPQHSEKRGRRASMPKGVSAACQCARKDHLSNPDRANKAMQVQMCCR